MRYLRERVELLVARNSAGVNIDTPVDFCEPRRGRRRLVNGEVKGTNWISLCNHVERKLAKRDWWFQLPCNIVCCCRFARNKGSQQQVNWLGFVAVGDRSGDRFEFRILLVVSDPGADDTADRLYRLVPEQRDSVRNIFQNT